MKTIVLRYSFLAVALVLASCQSTPAKKTPTQTGKTLDTPPAAESQFLPTAPNGEQATPITDNGAPQVSTTETTKPADTGTTPAVDPTPAKPEPPKTADTPSSTTPPPVATPTSTKLPYGKPVPGHKGFVTSPYDGSAGMIDVRDIAPGTKVRDPYTSKIFLVP